MQRRMVDIKYVSEKFCMSRSFLYEMLNSRGEYFDKQFPRPVQLGKRSVRWFEDELDAYLESRPRAAAGLQGDE